jgi:hypothetical protein
LPVSWRFRKKYYVIGRGKSQGYDVILSAVIACPYKVIAICLLTKSKLFAPPCEGGAVGDVVGEAGGLSGTPADFSDTSRTPKRSSRLQMLKS